MSEPFEPALLPDDEKRELCEGLLREFGVSKWRTTMKGELIHSCPIPGGHRNGDKNPSASLNFKKLTFNCLGCGSRGGLLWFIGTCRGGEDAESVREWLSGATGTGGHVMDYGRLMEILDAFEAPLAKPPPMPRYAYSALTPWTSWPIHHPYLTEPPPDGRGCHPETLTYFKIGYAEEYSMGEHREPQERIVIPQLWMGELVGWQARRLAPWDEPKYKFSPDFPRDRTLYNYHHYPNALVVESPLSVLRHHHHIPQILSTFGAEVTDVQHQLLQRYHNVYLWYDNDEAGWKATEAVGEALTPFVNVWVVDSPYTQDPAELSDAAAEELIEAAVPFSVWERPRSLTSWKGE